MVQSPLQSEYTGLLKKQKGEFLTKLLEDSRIKKSRGWILKYLQGVFETRGIDEVVENIGLKLLWDLGFIKEIVNEKPKLLAIKIPKNSKTKIAVSLEIEENELVNLYQNSIKLKDLSHAGTAWIKFRRLANNKNLNPFLVLVEIIQQVKSEGEKAVPTLAAIYQKAIQSQDATEVGNAWNDFRIQACQRWRINSFLAATNIVKSNHLNYGKKTRQS